ncbi:CopG family transcriptional regulator [bacterium]|nr:CopG family transcriptional regulator [bacterium]
MSKTVTLRIDDSSYRLFKALSERENRPLSNYIETTVKRYIEENESVDEFEMVEIKANAALNRSLKRGTRDAKARRGRFV